MAHTVRQAPAATRGKKAKKTRRVRTTPIEDVVTFPIPRKRLIASFPIEVNLDKLRRRTPHVVFEPEGEED
jgi:hypothetical protein